MSGIVKKISTAAHNRTTYRVGLLQTKAYRVLKNHTTKSLAHLDVSSVDWAFMGVLYDHEKGIRSSEMAEELGVEAPFVTAIFNQLYKKDFVETKPDKADSRAKIMYLTKKGTDFVQNTETYLRSAVKPLLEGVSVKDIVSYLVVLEKIIENSK